ncbi:ZP domain-containing protein [Holothuria leucospilota]|uniref:ZP domain-containing protein n=1 Tax=Holothuria leucospilota TaxID=206669 RepID=A0A9Q0YLR7_HOLLE|nr:ZP domain-containing protein [Holothuria leucospilota]
MFRFLTVLMFGSILLQFTKARHFRGGYISWKPTENEGQIELFFRLAYRHGFFSDTDTNEEGEDCTPEAIQNRTPIPTGGEFNCLTYYEEDGETKERETELFGGSPPLYTCTNIRDEGDDTRLHWASGYNRTVITLPHQNDSLVWNVGYDSCCWVNTLVNYGSPRTWRLRTRVDLSPRADLGGVPNSSPYVEGLPMKIVPQDCVTYIPINAIDPNGDTIKCRWTSERKGDCESPNCGNPDPNIFEMRRDTCTIKVDAGAADEGLYAVAVIIEDFVDGRRRRKPFSKISYQFLVLIQRRDVDCNRVVTETPEKACYAVPLVITPPFKFVLRAETIDPSVPIQSIDMITQPGMEVSDLIQDGNGRAHVEVTWTPTADKSGTVEQLCYQAVDQQNIAGQEVCALLYVGGEVPEPIPEISIPNSNTSHRVKFDNKNWKLYFTSEVQLGDDTQNAAVRFLYENGTEAYALTLKTANTVNISSQEPYYIEFDTPEFILMSNTTYTIRLEEGAMVGTKGCHLLSEKAEWSFTTEIFKRGLQEIHFPDIVTVVCRPTFMVAYIKKDYVPEIDPSLLTYEDPDCYGVDHNETHFAVGTMYGKCGTNAILNEDQTRVSMVNTLYIPKIGSFVFDGGITRSKNDEVRVNCSIPTRRVAYVEFNTNSSTDMVKLDSVGDFDFSLKMFPDENYRGAYRIWDFPVYVDETSRLYFEARTFTASSLSPFLEECVASPTADPEGTLTYTLIRDGCPVDETIEFHDGPASRVRFSIEAFSFIGYNLQSSIFVHCEFRDCNRRNGSCDTNCPDPGLQPNLAKRSVTSIRVDNSDPSTDGPIRILAKKRHNTQDQQRTFSSGEVVLIVLVSVAIVITMTLTLFVVKGQRQRGSVECSLCRQKIRQVEPAVIKLRQ